MIIKDLNDLLSLGLKINFVIENNVEQALSNGHSVVYENKILSWINKDTGEKNTIAVFG